MNDTIIKKNKFIVFLAGLFTVAMVCFPEVTEAGSKSAIIIWANSIVPVLLPFFIFSDFIKRTGDLTKLPPRVYPFAVAVLSGYPMGAKVVGDLVSNRTLEPAEGRWVLSYSMVTGPAFLMGTIGGFLGSVSAGVVVMTAHYCGALLNGVLWRIWSDPAKSVHKEKSRHPASSPAKTILPRQRSLMENFSMAIMSGFRAMAVILAYLIFFMIGINLLELAGVFSLIGNETVSSVLKGMLEMTAGSSMIGACNISLQLKTVLCSFLVSFGGLSVIGQSVSMAEGSGIGLADILKIKLTHGLLAGILAVILVQIMV